jgi:hypothetical protein
MIEAMYGVEFLSNEMAFAYGVVVLQKDRVLGGDTSFIYVGDYEVHNKVLYAKINCTNYREVLPPLFGDLNKVNLILEGTINDSDFTIQGRVVESPEQFITIKFTRVAELL